MAVLLVEHDIGLVMDVCASIHVIDYGALVAVGTPDEIRSNRAVIDAYLGDGSSSSRPISTRTRADHSNDPGEAPTDTATPVLELRNITASYGKIEVLHGIDVVVPRGKVVALLGPNGSGKSTTLKVASGQTATERRMYSSRRPACQRCRRPRVGTHRAVHDPRRSRRVPEL